MGYRLKGIGEMATEMAMKAFKGPMRAGGGGFKMKTIEEMAAAMKTNVASHLTPSSAGAYTSAEIERNLATGRKTVFRPSSGFVGPVSSPGVGSADFMGPMPKAPRTTGTSPFSLGASLGRTASVAGARAWQGITGGSLMEAASPFVKRAVQGAAVGGVAGYAGNIFAPNLVSSDSPFSAAMGGAALGLGMGALHLGAQGMVKSNFLKNYAPLAHSAATKTVGALERPVMKKALFAAGVMGGMEAHFTRPGNPNPTSRR